MWGFPSLWRRASAFARRAASACGPVSRALTLEEMKLLIDKARCPAAATARPYKNGTRRVNSFRRRRKSAQKRVDALKRILPVDLLTAQPLVAVISLIIAAPIVAQQ